MLLDRALPGCIIVFTFLVIGLLVLCDSFFVPCLQRIRVVGNIPEHVVGESTLARSWMTEHDQVLC